MSFLLAPAYYHILYLFTFVGLHFCICRKNTVHMAALTFFPYQCHHHHHEQYLHEYHDDDDQHHHHPHQHSHLHNHCDVSWCDAESDTAHLNEDATMHLWAAIDAQLSSASSSASTSSSTFDDLPAYGITYQSATVGPQSTPPSKPLCWFSLSPTPQCHKSHVKSLHHHHQCNSQNASKSHISQKNPKNMCNYSTQQLSYDGVYSCPHSCIVLQIYCNFLHKYCTVVHK